MEEGVSANTISHYHANIHKALSYAVKMGRIKENPSDRVELPKQQKHISHSFSVSEQNVLIQAAKGTNLETVILLAAWFGLRRGEIVGLRWSSIDLINGTLSINGTVKDKGESGSKIRNLRFEETAKTSASIRSFPLTTSQIEYFQHLQAQQAINKTRLFYNHKWDDFVCVRDNGDLFPLEYISRAVPQLCEKCGLPRLKLHELRHTNISLLLESGTTMKELQEWAGHSSYSTTANIYSHLQAQSKIKMSEYLANILVD